MISRVTDSRAGFTLTEVVVACALVCLLSACAYRGIIIVANSAKAMSLRISAQGLCLRQLQLLKSFEFREINEMSPRLQSETALLIARGIGDGANNVRLNYVISGENSPQRKNVTVTCSWDFKGRSFHESVGGFIVDSYSTNSERINLDVNNFCLNPGYETDHTRITPVYFRIVATDGTEYSQADMGSIPSNLQATSIIIYPGGGDTQKPFVNSKNKKIENSKTTSFYSRDVSNPLNVSLSKSNGKWFLDVSCSDASYSSL